MTDLRADLIEAIVGALPGPGYDLAPPDEHADAVLDAVLGVLADRADEWTDATYPNSHPALHTVRSMTVRKFVAVLRGDTP